MVNTNSQVGSINSVASGTYISCPKCGSNNKTDNKFCIVCGAEIINRKETETSAPAFGSVENAVTDKRGSMWSQTMRLRRDCRNGASNLRKLPSGGVD